MLERLTDYIVHGMRYRPLRTLLTFMFIMFAVVLMLISAFIVPLAHGAEVSVGLGIQDDGNYDYENGRDDDNDVTSVHETAILVIQGDWTNTVKYGYMHTSLLLETDSDVGENVAYLAYQDTLLTVVEVSMAIGVVDNEGAAYRQGKSPKRNNPVAVLTWRHPLSKSMRYRATYVTSMDGSGERYQTFYSGIEYLHKL